MPLQPANPLQPLSMTFATSAPDSPELPLLHAILASLQLPPITTSTLAVTALPSLVSLHLPSAPSLQQHYRSKTPNAQHAPLQSTNRRRGRPRQVHATITRRGYIWLPPGRIAEKRAAAAAARQRALQVSPIASLDNYCPGATAHTCGPMTFACHFCGALFFKNMNTGRDNQGYTFGGKCCLNGAVPKATLPLQLPPPL